MPPARRSCDCRVAIRKILPSPGSIVEWQRFGRTDACRSRMAGNVRQQTDGDKRSA